MNHVLLFLILDYYCVAKVNTFLVMMRFSSEKIQITCPKAAENDAKASPRPAAVVSYHCLPPTAFPLRQDVPTIFPLMPHQGNYQSVDHHVYHGFSGHKRRCGNLLLDNLLPHLQGDPGGTRTHDPLIKSQLLYQLSYGVIACCNCGAKVLLFSKPPIIMAVFFQKNVFFCSNWA